MLVASQQTPFFNAHNIIGSLNSQKTATKINTSTYSV